MVYHVGSPAMFDGNMFFPDTGTPGEVRRNIVLPDTGPANLKDDRKKAKFGVLVAESLAVGDWKAEFFAERSGLWWLATSWAAVSVADIRSSVPPWPVGLLQET